MTKPPFTTWEGRVEPDILDLLHQEADGDLPPEQARALAAALTDPAVAQARAALGRSVQALRTPLPPPPRSASPAVVSDLRLQARLTGAAAVPPAPRSVAEGVVSELRLSQQLRAAVLPAAPSVAQAVLTEMRAAQALAAPPLPRSLAADLAREIGSEARLRQALSGAQPPARPSVAASLAQRIAQEAAVAAEGLPETAAVPALPLPAPSPVARRNVAPLLLVGGLLCGLTLLTLSSAWPELRSGAVILQAVLRQVSPLAGLGLVLLALTSALVTWKPVPRMRRFGAAAFAVAGVLTLPPLYGVTQGHSGMSFGQTVVVRGPVKGDVISIAGDVRLEDGAQVDGHVLTLLGDIQQVGKVQVSGETSAVLGRAPNETAPLPQPQGVGLATAAAFRPLLGWMGAAAWPQIFVALTGGLLLLLFVGGVAPMLARRQRHAPMRTLALGNLILLALLTPAVCLGVSGLLAPALIMLTLAGLMVATGLSVSLYDAGRALACRLRLPVPDAVGAVLGLSALAASLSVPPLAFALALVGGVWGVGALFLHRRERSAMTQ